MKKIKKKINFRPLIILALAFVFFIFNIKINQIFSVKGITLDEFLLAKTFEKEDPITMIFTGDIMLGRYIATLIEKNGADFPFTYMPEIINEAKQRLEVDELDLIVGNLEGPITDYTSNSGKSISFHFEPSTAEMLKKAGFTTLSMANNHSFDQGRTGHAMTYDYLTEVGIQGFGHPDTPNGEWSLAKYEFDGFKIAFLGLNDTDFRLDHAETLAKIRELDLQFDFVIVGIHWGIEYEKTAREYIVNLAHSFVDAGVDFVWGHHPHVVQNWEIYNGAPIYYSLGNFVFDQYWSDETQKGMVVALKLEDGKITTKEISIDLINLGEPSTNGS